jgi:hypothetical protein
MASTCFQRKTDSSPSTSLSSRHPALPDIYSPKGGEISDSDDADVDDLPSFKEILADSRITQPQITPPVIDLITENENDDTAVSCR